MAQKDFEALLKTITSLNVRLEQTSTLLADLSAVGGKSSLTRANMISSLKDETTRLNAELNLAAENFKKMKASSSYIPGGKNSAAQTPVTPTPEGNLRRGYIKSNSGLPEITSEREAMEKQIVDSLRKRVTEEKRYVQALEQARLQGFDTQHLVRAQSKGTSGIEQLQFQRYDEGGTLRRFDTFVNPNGRSTPGISNQFRSFGQGVLRDIGELTKWSLALAAVYTPMQKLGELIQQMIANEVKLAEATISVNSSFVDQSKIFDTAVTSANAAGEAVSGVIDAFTLAYRAAGGGGTEVERFSTSVKLLNDSLTLSKLSTLDQAGAIDTLSAALRQSASSFDSNLNPLQQGTTLLDKWVRVTKVANVDMTTLATGFAVVGDAADAAGISVDQLNGLIAAISETGISTGKETANIARSIVSGFQSDQAIRELDNLGIAVKTTTGEMRPFLEVMQEVYNLRQQGAISDTQFSKLTLALGGGTRRQAAYSSFIENFDRVFSIAQESEKASGDAEAALNKQLDTVQTGLEKLGNAFSTLAQSVGTEGGFLDIMKGGISILTSVVTAFDGLISVLGKATPAMAAFIATSLILKQQGYGGIQNYIGGLGQRLITSPEELRLQAAGQGLSAANPTLKQRAGNLLGAGLGTSGVGAGVFQGIAVSLLPALQNIFNKEDRFGKLKGGADIIGGVAGGVIGTLVAGSPVIGAAIGTAISEAFVNSTVARKTDIFGYGKETTITPGGVGASTANDKEARLKEAEIGLYKSIGFGNEALGRIRTTASANKLPEYVEGLNKAIASGDRKQLDEYLQGANIESGVKREKILESYGITKDDILKAFNTGGKIEASPERPAYLKASPEARAEYDRALAEYNAQLPSANISTEFTKRIGENKNAYQPVLDVVSEQIRQQISQERLSGDLKGTAYTQQTKALSGADTKTLQYFTAFGKEFQKMNKDIKTSTDLFKAFTEITVYGSQESVNELTAITSEISTIINLLNDPALKDQKLLNFQGADFSRQELQQMLTQRIQTASTLATDTYQQAQLSRLQIPEVQGDINKPLTSQEFGSVVQLATQLQEKFYKGFLDIPDQLYDGLKSSWDEWAQIIQDSGDAFYQKVEGIDPQFFQQAMQKLIEEGKIASQKANPFGIQQVDLPGSKLGELQNLTSYFGNYLSKNFPQYKQNPEDIGVIFNDYVTGTLHGDNLAIKLALEKLVDINQKQLDGMYNIPEGATFWVPLTAAYYRNQNGGGGGGLPEVDTTGLNTAGDNLDGAANALTSAADYLKNSFNNPHPYRKGDTFELDRKYDTSTSTTPGSQIRSEAMRDYLNEIKSTGYESARQLGDESIAAHGKRRGTNVPTTPVVQEPSAQPASYLDVLRQKLLDAFVGTKQQGSLQQPSAQASVNSLRNISQTQSGQQTPVSAKLEMKIDNNTQLIVDGRVLASVISPFLASELVRLESSQGTVSKRYVI